MKKKLFLIIGAPGSGKTTDASLIAKKHETYAHFSTGELLRDEVASGSELGKTIDSFISKGNLVPLEVVINTIMSAIKNAKEQTILIDGYPRSVEQMNALDDELKKTSEIDLVGVIEVYVSENTAKERVLGRARGADDNEEVFKNRMKVYMQPLDEIIKFYKEKDVYLQINGERTIDEIVADMDEKIANLIKK